MTTLVADLAKNPCYERSKNGAPTMYVTAAVVALIAISCAGIGIIKVRRQPIACPHCMALQESSSTICSVCGCKLKG